MASRALSREGHAAMSMRGESDRWILIQKNTFTNWVNEQLRVGGFNNFVNELNNDFDDGVRLCNLIQSLQGKPIGKVIKKPINHHQNLENVALALNAIAKDNVRLVNIGPEDIVNGNLKLILGLVWHLILRYQIGKTKFPAKKLMLAWLQAVIPECNITNFTSCWNDGVALHALINYCDPGIEECQNWRYLSRSDPLGNCEKAMALARQHFDIPLVVRPEDLSSPDLDELSGMTYLSYFMKVDSPGYKMTMSTVKRLLRQGTFNNFTTDWSDGRVLCNLVTSLGEPATPGSEPIENLQRGIDSAKRLGVEPILTAKEMNDPEVDHIGIMAYAAYFSKFKPVRSPAEKIVMSGTPRNAFVGQETRFNLRLEDDGISPSDVRAEVKGPDSNPNVVFEWHGRSGEGIFTPQETGAHRLNVYCENSLIVGCPVSFKVSADRSKVRYIGPELCTVGQYSEIKVDCSAAGQGDVECEARNPHGRIQKLTAIYRNGSYIVNFNPTEVGIYRISVRYDGEEIYGSPFSVMVNDPSRVRVYGLEGGSVGSSLRFNADTSEAGDGELHVEVSKDGEFVSSHIHHERVGLEAIDFTPYGPGTYKVFVRYNDVDVRGSPFTVEIVDSTQVSVRGDGISLVPVNRSTSFIVDTQGSSSGRVDVEIFSPSKKNVKCNIVKDLPGIHRVEYTPSESGDHAIHIKYCERPVTGSPFICGVYDIDQVVVTGMPAFAKVNSPVKFKIDASKAGSGNIEIIVNNGRIPCSVQNMNNYCFNASFVPDTIEPHVVQMKFNNQPVKGSPWKVIVKDDKLRNSVKLIGDRNHFAHVNKKAIFYVGLQGLDMDQLRVKIIAPSGSNVPFDIRNYDGEYHIEYVPKEVGDHRLEIKYNDKEVEGSPFKAKAYNTAAIYVTPLRNVPLGKTVDFNIDVTKAGEGQLEIMVNNGNLPNTVEMPEAGVYKITFKPESPGKQYVDINFNGEALPDSPFTCNAYDASGLKLRGFSEIVASNKSTVFTIESSSGDDDMSPVVDIYSPTGKEVPSKIIQIDADYMVEFKPVVTGVHTIEVKLGDSHIMESPYKVNVFDPKKVKVVDLPKKLFTGNDCHFRVDATEAGDGALEVIIFCEAKTIPHKLVTLEEGLYEVTFRGTEPYRHRIHMTFNGDYVKGSPFWVEYEDEIEVVQAEFSKVQFVQSRTLAGITFAGVVGMIKYFTVDVIAPSGSKLNAKIRESSPGTYCVEWKPVEVGSYLIEVRFYDEMVEGFPMVVKVFDVNRVKVMNKLIEGEIREEYFLTFSVADAGEGRLEVMVDCDGESIPSTVKQTDVGTFTASFVPRKGGKYIITVLFNDLHVPGSPFVVHVAEEQITTTTVTEVLHQRAPVSVTMNTKQLLIDKSQWFVLETYGGHVDDNNMKITIIAPSNSRVPASLVSQGGGNFKVEWTPNEIGRHRVEVEFAGRQIDGSPFYVDVFDLMSLKVHNFKSEGVGEQATFELDLANAVGMEEVEIVSPSGSNVSFGVDTQSTFDGVQKIIKYYPDIAGDYKIYVKFAGYDLPRCPFIQNIDEGGMPTAEGEGLYKGEEDRIANFYVDVGNRRGELDVLCEGPNSIAKTNIEPSGDRYMVTYIPVEVGIFSLSVRWNGKEIPGSPFRPKVVDARKVRLVGGWQQYFDNEERVRLIVGQEKTLLFDISQAGPGNLRAEVVGPSRHIPVAIDTPAHGQSVVIFTPEEEGNHYIHLFWSEHTLSGSPFLGYATSGDSNKVVLTGRGLKEAKVREEAEFVIDGSQAGPGVPEVNLSGVRAEIPNKVVPLGNGRFRCTYVPMIPGAYLLNITWNGRTLKGSPYKVNVIGAFFPNKVVVSGEGLKGGIVGSPMDILIDVKRAGPGELTASCVGPTQVAHCELEDNHDGTFILYIKPVEPGKHLLHVKYGGEHVQRSPFMIRVGSQPDASKVRVHGPGVEHGLLPTFKSNFTVETRGAGAGQLTVRVKGPRGGFQVEMYRDSQRDRTIICRYDPIEIGEYYISVKWSGKDVPGSPFVVLIYDTQHDLERALQTLAMRNEMERASSLPRSLPVSARSYEQWRNEL